MVRRICECSVSKIFYLFKVSSVSTGKAHVIADCKWRQSCFDVHQVADNSLRLRALFSILAQPSFCAKDLCSGSYLVRGLSLDTI